MMTVRDGRIVSVKPKPTVMLLIAVTVGDAQTKDWRSRPGSVPEMCTLAGVSIEGLEELVELSTQLHLDAS
jgi:hypothetical protein